MKDAAHEAMHGTWKSYIVGFALSIVLTLATYFVVVRHLFPDSQIIIVIIALALMQGVVQLLLFLHIGQESKPRSILFMFLLLLLILVIILIGSLWIMYDLDARMMHMGT